MSHYETQIEEFFGEQDLGQYVNKIPDDKPDSLKKQVGGSHYKNLKIQPIEYCHVNNLGPCESSIVRYITRWRDKNGKEDLLKIKQYVDILIDLEEL